MKKSTSLLLGLSLITVGLVVWGLLKEMGNEEYDAARIADEGYETAHDILYPYQSYEADKGLHFGPVIPG